MFHYFHITELHLLRSRKGRFTGENELNRASNSPDEESRPETSVAHFLLQMPTLLSFTGSSFFSPDSGISDHLWFHIEHLAWFDYTTSYKNHYTPPLGRTEESEGYSIVTLLNSVRSFHSIPGRVICDSDQLKIGMIQREKEFKGIGSVRSDTEMRKTGIAYINITVALKYSVFISIAIPLIYHTVKTI